MSEIQIKQLQSGQESRWDAFVHQAEGATFFHLSGWKRVIEEAFGHAVYLLYAELNGEIAGVLPLGHVKSLLFGNALSSMPFCVYGGVVASNDLVKTALESHAVELAKSLGVDHLEIRNQAELHSDWPAKRDLYVTFRKAIDPDPEQNMKNIPRKQRAMVRKGIKAGLVSEWDDGIDRFYDAYSQSVHALGTPVFSKRYFEILKQVFGDDCRVLTVLSKEGQLVASVMNFYFRDQVLPYYGGGTAEARSVKGNDFMYWEVMRDSCERGLKLFDYGRSKVGTGSYSFKKNWGFEPEPLHYEYVLVKAKEIPDVNPLNPKYQLFIKTWKKLPLSMTRMLGPHIVKNLA